MPSTHSPFPPEWSEPATAEQKERWSSVTIGDKAPGQSNTDPNFIRPMERPVWEGSKVMEKRPGGFEIPMVHAHSPSQPVTAKQYQNNRAGYDKQREMLRNDPTALTKKVN